MRFGRALVGLCFMAIASTANYCHAQTILMVTDASTLNAGENSRRTQLQNWGYTVTTVVDSSSQAVIDAAVATADAVFIPVTITDWEFENKLRTCTKGIVCEERYLDDNFGLSTSSGWDTTSYTQINITNNTHEITNSFSTGNLTIFSSSGQQMALMNPTYATGLTTLAEQNWGNKALAVVEAGGTLANTINGNSTAAGRRVHLPWGGDSFNWSALNANGLTILQKSLQWAIGKRLLLHYKLDQTSGTSVPDSSGNNYTGTVTGTATWVPAIRNNGFDFNGSTKIQVNSELGNPANVSMAAWVDLDAVDTSGAEIISIGDHVIFRLTSTQVRATLYNGSSWTTTSAAYSAVGTGWHHYAFTFDDAANQLKIFIDGVLVTTATVTTTISYSGLGSATVVGRHGNGSTAFDLDGRVDDVRVYNYALTNSEIAEIYGLIGHWKLDQTAGTSAVDSTLMANPGTYTNGVTLNAVGPYPGAGSIAANFDGVNDYVAIPNESLYDVTETMTVAAWVKVDQFTKSYQTIISKGDSAWRISRNNNASTLHFAIGTTNDRKLNGTIPIDDGNWHHVVGTYDGSTMRLYVDGQLDGSLAAASSIQTNDFNVWIGANQDRSGREFIGPMHDVRVYNRALSAAEVAALYGLISHWKLDETSGTIATDSMSTANHGNYQNNVTKGLSGPPLYTDNLAAQFGGGANDRVQVPGFGVSGSGITILGWFKANSFGDRHFVSKATGTDTASYHWMLGTASSTQLRARVKINGTTREILPTVGSMSAGSWYHAAVTYDGSTMRAFLNGTQYGTGSWSGNVSMDSTVAVALGNQPSGAGDRAFNGMLDDLRVYNRPLWPEEIDAIYQGGRPVGIRIMRWTEVR